MNSLLLNKKLLYENIFLDADSRVICARLLFEGEELQKPATPARAERGGFSRCIAGMGRADRHRKERLYADRRLPGCADTYRGHEYAVWEKVSDDCPRRSE